MLAQVANKDMQTVISALIKQAKTLANELHKSLTWDRGKELTDHRRFTLATAINVYFRNPQNPWQRGSDENRNGLLRQYFPKGTELSITRKPISGAQWVQDFSDYLDYESRAEIRFFARYRSSTSVRHQSLTSKFK